MRTEIGKVKVEYFGEINFYEDKNGICSAYNETFREYPKPFAQEENLEKLKTTVGRELKKYIVDKHDSTKSKLHFLKDLKRENWLEKITTQNLQSKSEEVGK
jgi:hypothetical protein